MSTKVPASALSKPHSNDVVVAPSANTVKTLLECEDSARFWTAKLPSYGQKMQNLADRYAIGAAALAALTALGVWGTLADSTQILAAVAVSVASIATALVTAIPKIKGWAECAGAVPGLVARYGHTIGDLENARAALTHGLAGADRQAERARAEFEAVKADKQRLRPFPTALQEERDSKKPPRG